MKNILVFGDSNTWGYDYTKYIPAIGSAKRLDFDERWPGKVQIALGPDFRIIENALNARTSLQNDPYFPNRLGIRSLVESLDANSPLDMVVLQIGCNELKAMFNLSAGMVAFGVEQLVLACKVPYYGYDLPKIILIAPSPTHPQIGKMQFGFSFGDCAYKKSLEFGKYYRLIAERHQCEFIDCADLNMELNEVDGLHYSKKDHEKLAKAVVDKIKNIYK